MAELGWVAVIPVKVLSHAKTRLLLPDEIRVALARAFALDVIDAVASSAAIVATVLVSDEPVVRECAEAVLGDSLTIVDDGGGWAAGGALDADLGSDPGAGLDGLNAAIARGVAAAGSHPVIVLTADLPALRGSDIDAVVAAVGHAPRGGAGRVVVADAAGTGTAMIAAFDRPLATAFGVGSAAQHAGMGYRLLADAPLRARHDVDTVDDLVSGVALTLGRHTSAVIDEYPELLAAVGTATSALDAVSITG